MFDVVRGLQASCSGRLDMYSAQDPGLTAKLLEEIQHLEKAVSARPGAGFGANSIRSSVAGRWRLVFTDSRVVIKNKGGITGLPVPGAHCTQVQVSLEPSGRAQTAEFLKLGFLTPVNYLLGSWSLSGKSGRILEVTYAEAVVCGGPKLRADSKAVLETTFVGSHIRVGRSKSGDVYLFQRIAGDEDGGMESG